MRIELGQNLDLSSFFWNKYYCLFLLYKNAMKTERDIISELCFEIIGRIINQWINQCISLYWYKRFIWRLWKWKCREGKRPAQGGTANWGPDQDYGPYFLSLASVFPWHHLSLSSSSNVLIVTFFFSWGTEFYFWTILTSRANSYVIQKAFSTFPAFLASEGWNFPTVCFRIEMQRETLSYLHSALLKHWKSADLPTVFPAISCHLPAKTHVQCHGVW